MRLFPLLLCSLVYGQEFDVASIKASAPFPTSGGFRIAPPTGGPGTNDPTHYTWPSATIQSMLLRGYNVKGYQISGPDWLSADRFDISVVIPEGATKPDLEAMWRNLLASRFGVKVRVEKKEFAVDELIIGPRGHKLKETADPNVSPLTAVNGSPVDKDGRLNGAGLLTMMRSGPTGITAQAIGMAQPISALADLLGNQLKHPVVDKTGLTGKYDFMVDFSPTASAPLPAAGGGAAAPQAPINFNDLAMDLPNAMQQQLGLRLEKGKGMLDYIVVEKAERVPTEN